MTFTASPGEGRVFFLVKLEADKVDDVMNDFLAFAGARDCRIYVYRRRPIHDIVRSQPEKAGRKIKSNFYPASTQ